MSKNKVCLNMIVKDESPVIIRCLETLVGFIDSYVIVDTGSSDGTQQLIKDFMDSKDIPGEVYNRPWVNFEKNRNEALDLAYKENVSDYIFFIDADEMFHCNKLQIVKEAIGHELDYYLIEKHFGGMRYALPALIKKTSLLKWSWKGVVHEALTPIDTPEFSRNDAKVGQLALCNISARHGEGIRSRGKTLEEKFLADAKVLEDELEKNPEDTRSRFYLAQSYRDAGKPDLAINSYEIRSKMGGWNEEVYYSYFQIGCLLLSKDKYSEAVTKMLKACATKRDRSLEPLYHLLKYCRKNKMFEEANLWGNMALAFLEKPKRDILFVPHDVYAWGLLDEFAISLAESGSYVEGFNYMNKLMHTKNIPGEARERIFRNTLVVLNKIPALAQPEIQ